MTLLAGKLYDPGTAVSKVTDTLIAMTAIDTTNLRVTFTAPANGIVLVRLQGVLHGATTSPQILLGVLDGATVRGRGAPRTTKATAIANSQLVASTMFLVTGLTPGQSYTWDAAYGVEFAVASTGLKYGGPNNTVANDAFGGFSFEVWNTTNLLAGEHYDPGSAVANKSVATAAVLAALDTTNLRLTFTAPPTGNVLVHLRCMLSGSTTVPTITLGVLDGATVKGRVVPEHSWNDVASTIAATTQQVQDALFVVTGLTPGQSYTWDAAYGVELVGASANIKYGGPDDATQDDAYGGFAFEVWAA